MNGLRTLIYTRSEAVAFQMRRHFDPAHVLVLGYGRAPSEVFARAWCETPEGGTRGENQRACIEEHAATRIKDRATLHIVPLAELWALDLPRRRPYQPKEHTP